jgi:hypothetical protein
MAASPHRLCHSRCSQCLLDEDGTIGMTFSMESKLPWGNR